MAPVDAIAIHYLPAVTGNLKTIIFEAISSVQASRVNKIIFVGQFPERKVNESITKGKQTLSSAYSAL